MLRLATLAVSLWLLCGLVVPQASLAQSGDAGGPLAGELTGPALADYRAGHVAFLDGDYKGALLKFKAAYEASRHPGLLWNIAACEKDLRRYARVVELLEQYKIDAAGRMTDERTQRVDELLQMMTPYVAKMTLAVQPPSAEITVDGERLGSAPLARSVLVSHGQRTLRVTKSGFIAHEQVLEVKGGSSVSVSVTLVEQPKVGALSIIASPGDQISVDGSAVGTSSWQGDLSAGDHRVLVAAHARIPFETTVVVKPSETATLRVVLMPLGNGEDSDGVDTWVWVTGGVALAAGLAVAGFFVFRPADAADPVAGTLPPGVIPIYAQ